MLVNVLTSATSNVKDSAAANVASLAAMAVWRASEANQQIKVMMAEAGAITPLVGMLGSVSTEMQMTAAGALASLAQDSLENQLAIARTGAIAPLCSLVREGASETKETCAQALWSLSADNAANKATIAKLGGIEPLVALLVSGGTEKSHRYASGALSSLACKHAENRSSIAKRLVVLLNGKGVERGMRVLSAVSHLCIDHPANQVAIAKAGGIPPLIVWLNHVNEECQKVASKAMLSLAANNATAQSMITRLDGIPAIIALVRRSAVVAQENATQALWHLASSTESQLAIAEAGALAPLVALLSAEGPRAPELATVTLVRLAHANPKVSTAIADLAQCQTAAGPARCHHHAERRGGFLRAAHRFGKFGQLLAGYAAGPGSSAAVQLGQILRHPVQPKPLREPLRRFDPSVGAHQQGQRRRFVNHPRHPPGAALNGFSLAPARARRKHHPGRSQHPSSEQ